MIFGNKSPDEGRQHGRLPSFGGRRTSGNHRLVANAALQLPNAQRRKKQPSGALQPANGLRRRFLRSNRLLWSGRAAFPSTFGAAFWSGRHGFVRSFQAPRGPRQGRGLTCKQSQMGLQESVGIGLLVVRGHFIHDRLPRPRGHFGIMRGQLSASQAEVERWLPVCLVLRVEQPFCFAALGRSQRPASGSRSPASSIFRYASGRGGI